MKTIKFILVVVLGVFALTGCAGTNAKYSDLYQSGMLISPEEVNEDIQTRISEANSQCENGKFRQAIRTYDELFNKYRSTGSRLEVALVTNKAMCYLEDGDQGGFMRSADQLDKMSAGMQYLSIETQYLLEIHKKMDGVIAPSDDPRVEQRISSSVNKLFEKEEK